MMHNFILNKRAKFKRDWAKNNTIIVINVENTVLCEKLLFITTAEDHYGAYETLKQYCSWVFLWRYYKITAITFKITFNSSLPFCSYRYVRFYNFAI